VLDTTKPYAPVFKDPTKVLVNTINYTNRIGAEEYAMLYLYRDGQQVSIQDERLFQVEFTEGIHEIGVVAEDRALNKSDITTISVRVDLTSPKLISENISELKFIKAGRYPVNLEFNEKMDSNNKPVITLVGSSKIVAVNQVSYSGTQFAGIVDIQPGMDDEYGISIADATDLAQNKVKIII